MNITIAHKHMVNSKPYKRSSLLQDQPQSKQLTFQPLGCHAINELEGFLRKGGTQKQADLIQIWQIIYYGREFFQQI